MIWHKPTDEQLQKYRKGCQIRKMRNPAIQIQQPEKYTIDTLQNVSELQLTQNNPMLEMINAEKKCNDLRLVREIEKRSKEAQVQNLLEKLYSFQDNDFPTYHAYDSIIKSDSLVHRFKIVACPLHCGDFYKNVCTGLSQYLNISQESTGQSQTQVWFAERFVRITSSQRAHQIKTRRTNLEGLAKQFINQSFKGALTPDMRYGIEMEPNAASKFEELTGLAVHRVGLIISKKQPFLACSPDGIIDNHGIFELLEIKCPSSCKDSKIIDLEARQIKVPYLIFENDSGNEITLKRVDKYFTQVQVSLYVLGLNSCHFFVYSLEDHVHIIIQRDEQFLSEVIPKIENFYFKYFITLLKTNHFFISGSLLLANTQAMNIMSSILSNNSI
ncbi:uncharacterized protein [Atheta coriaria]|uniref:uncharacterized protein n=1 Tax=Dalotia coriaria TaxID=877792 RepID=UPI0031F3D341